MGDQHTARKILTTWTLAALLASRDRYGRVVAVCRALGEDLSAWMAGLGRALAYREYSRQYVLAEELAEKRKAGMWSGRFEPPWEWRVERRGGGR